MRHCFEQLRSTQVAVVHCSAQTSPMHVLQKLQQSCMVISSNTGRVYRPKDCERLVLYLKDLNLPKPDKWGTSQLIAFLQQVKTFFLEYDIVQVNHTKGREKMRKSVFLSFRAARLSVTSSLPFATSQKSNAKLSFKRQLKHADYWFQVILFRFTVNTNPIIEYLHLGSHIDPRKQKNGSECKFSLIPCGSDWYTSQCYHRFSVLDQQQGFQAVM